MLKYALCDLKCSHVIDPEASEGHGVSVGQELAHLVVELPALFEQVLAALPNILPVIMYYQSFVHYTTQRMPEDSNFLPMLCYILKEGNVTWYQWKHGEPPNDVILSEVLAKSSLELESGSGSTDLEIDWGNVVTNNTSTGQSDGIDFGESEIDFSADAVDLSVITIEDSGEGGEGKSDQMSGETLVPLATDGKDEPTVTSATHETVLGTTQTRNLFLDDLMELREFLTQRQQELDSETTNILLAGQFGSSSDGLEVQSSEAVGEMLGHVTRVLDLLTNSRTQHLFLIKGSPRYLDRLASSLLQQLKLSQRAASQAWNHATRRTEAAAMATSVEPRLARFISVTKALQTKIAAEISKRYSNRTVNIMGEINQI